MFKSNPAKNLISKSVETKMLQSTYASAGGKSKIPDEYNSIFSDKEKKYKINNHVQYITDFNIIYSNPQQIRLYQIANLYTKCTQKSYEISEKQNYRLEMASQNIEFFTVPIRIKAKAYLVHNSNKYFEQKAIQKSIEDKKEYQILYNKVLEELKKDNISFRIAETEEHLQLTGLKFLQNQQNEESINNTTSYMQPLQIPYEEKDN